MRRSVRRRNHMWRRVFGTELKRLLKTRSVLILMAACSCIGAGSGLFSCILCFLYLSG